MRKANPPLAQNLWLPGDYVNADLIDVVMWYISRGKAQPYPRPQERIAQWHDQQDRFAALEAQAERNRAREIES